MVLFIEKQLSAANKLGLEKRRKKTIYFFITSNELAPNQQE
tara:strand:- start:82 stop:204 length:123 start_codon:yes stop_codon:yes gene_type:complete